MTTSKQPSRNPLYLWLHLTREERNLVLAIVVIALVGLTARYIHLRTQSPDEHSVPVERLLE